jgi:fructose-1-phosphate kinase PfkB-like protein
VGVAVATKDTLDFVHGVKINLVSAVGAGDSFVAGVMLKYSEYRKANLGFNWRDIAAFGVATASASCEESLSGGINVTRALELYNQILVSEGAA